MACTPIQPIPSPEGGWGRDCFGATMPDRCLTGENETPRPRLAPIPALSRIRWEMALVTHSVQSPSRQPVGYVEDCCGHEPVSP
jgi:hypothetical protein